MARSYRAWRVPGQLFDPGWFFFPRSLLFTPYWLCVTRTEFRELGVRVVS
jgi:hypothetical protein